MQINNIHGFISKTQINYGEEGIKDIEINSIEEFISHIKNLTKKGSKVFYRGQSDISYKLKPSVYRVNAKDKEDKIYLKVLSECSNEFDTNMAHIDIISKMQHYGVHTRLLDITTNALVALYFACGESVKDKDKDGCVYIFNPYEKQIKQFDSDTVSILSSLPRFNSCEKNILFAFAKAYKNNRKEFNKLFNEEFDAPGNIVRRLLHEIKKEKPAFEDIIDPNDLLNNYFLLPRKDNPRIIRQSGAFIIFGLNESKAMEYYQRIKIPYNLKEDILKDLEYLGISKATLYPELYKVSEYIKDCIGNERDF